ncbi:MAG: FhaA domain-containing protein, partial [Acidimicrobiia bacterium]|nr:FhaA domain-containing protein [Acidimicrobiia bacterium]
MRLDDPLGHLIPPGTLTEAEISRGLIDAMDRKRFSAGLGVPSVPTRFVVTMHPSDRAYLDPRAEDRMADALARHADRSGWLVLGSIDVEFRIDRVAGTMHEPLTVPALVEQPACGVVEVSAGE